MAFPSKAAIIVGRAANTVKKYSPQIMMAVGAVSSVIAVVEAVKKTPEAEDILERHREEIDKAKEARELNDPEYGDKEYKRNICKIYIRTGKALAKNYAFPVAMELVSLLCFFGAYGTMSSRNKTTSIALASALETNNIYRKRVIEKLGEEEEEKLRLGLDKITNETFVVDENGKQKKVKEKLTIAKDPSHLGIYDIIWRPGDPGYDQNPEQRAYHVAKVSEYYTNALFERHLMKNVSLAEICKNFKSSEEAWSEIRHQSGYDQSCEDQRVIITMHDIAIPCEDNPNIFEDATILSFNCPGAIAFKEIFNEKR